MLPPLYKWSFVSAEYFDQPGRGLYFFFNIFFPVSWLVLPWSPFDDLPVKVADSQPWQTVIIQDDFIIITGLKTYTSGIID